jgi:hypothetical protein
VRGKRKQPANAVDTAAGPRPDHLCITAAGLDVLAKIAVPTARGHSVIEPVHEEPRETLADQGIMAEPADEGVTAATAGLSALPRGGEVCDCFYNRSPDVKALALQKSSAKLWVSGVFANVERK